MRKVFVYVDGLNLFHAIEDFKSPRLHWLDLWKLSETIIGSNETLSKVNYFTAYSTWNPAIFRRQERLVKALESRGVTVTLGKFKRKWITCKASCGETFMTHEEKETDVNIGAMLVADAIQGRFERAILITADTDIKAAVEIAMAETSGLSINVVAPPKRWGRARDLKPILELTKGRLRACRLPDDVHDDSGLLVVRCPNQWK